MGRLHELKKSFETKKISPQEYYEIELSKWKERNKKLNAYLGFFEERISRRLKAMTDPKEGGHLRGLPIAIKDIISVEGEELSAASKMLSGFRPPRSATVVERLEAEGAICTGRTNCDEFAMGSSNENSAYGPSLNPYDLERSTGGSSGGSGAAVAGQMAVAALGTDTGGSIRLPSSFCGITGLKPTYGRVSRSGVIAFASSLDQVGPMADDAIDCAEVLQIIAGKDDRDSTAMNVPVEDYVSACKNSDLKNSKIGFDPEYLESPDIPESIRKSLAEAKSQMEKAGARFEAISIPSARYGIAAYYVIAPAEASSNLARYDGIRYGHRAKNFSSLKELMFRSRSEGFGSEVKRRIMLGSFALSSGYYDAYYGKAQWIRSKIQKEFLEAFQKVDFLFWPSAPNSPFRLGHEEKNPLSLYLADIFTIPVNLAGLPAINFPIGWDNENLPVGAQLIGRPFSEAELLRGVSAFEKIMPFERRALAC